MTELNDIAVAYGCQYRKPEDLLESLQKSGALLGNAESREALSLNDTTFHEQEITIALTSLIRISRRTLLLQHQPEGQEQVWTTFKFTEYREPMSQEPYVKDNEDRAINLSELCRLIAEGAELTLEETPSNPA